MQIKILGHIVAVSVIMVWGTTFVCSKVLLNNGIDPDEIFLFRFVLAYFSLLAVSHRTMRCRSIRDEAIMVGLGLMGGSLYFLAENTALVYDTSSNVSILVGSTPLMTMLLVGWVKKSMRPNRKQIVGSLVAFAGMALIVLNGQLVLHLNPMGDALAMAASVTWAVYSLLMTYVSGRYSADVITRKVFFYGIVTILPVILMKDEWTLTYSVIRRPEVIGNLVFLGLVASTLCYLAWNWVLDRIGTFRATNYIYSQSMVTLVVAAMVLGEPITVMAVGGIVLLVLGMSLSERDIVDSEADDA